MALTKRQILLGIVAIFVVGIIVMGILKGKEIKEAFTTLSGRTIADKAVKTPEFSSVKVVSTSSRV
jgi:hypothetical protein